VVLQKSVVGLDCGFDVTQRLVCCPGSEQGFVGMRASWVNEGKFGIRRRSLLGLSARIEKTSPLQARVVGQSMPAV